MTTPVRCMCWYTAATTFLSTATVIDATTFLLLLTSNSRTLSRPLATAIVAPQQHTPHAASGPASSISSGTDLLLHYRFAVGFLGVGGWVLPRDARAAVFRLGRIAAVQIIQHDPAVSLTHHQHRILTAQRACIRRSG